MDQNPTPVAPTETPVAAPVAPAAKGANKNLIIGIVAAIVVVVAIVVVLIVVLGGNKSDAPATNGGSGSTAELSKCGDAFKCLEKIDENATVKSVNELTGIEGKVTSWSETVYEWEFPNGETIELSTSYFNVKIDYDTDLHKDSKVNFDGYSTVKDKIKSGITVDELAEALGTKGLLYKKDSFGYGYLWVDSNGGHLYANVSLKGNVTLVSGRF